MNDFYIDIIKDLTVLKFNIIEKKKGKTDFNNDIKPILNGWKEDPNVQKQLFIISDLDNKIRFNNIVLKVLQIFCALIY